RLWEEKLTDPREAADAWRRVLRMKPADPEATEGLERAKTNMLKRPKSDPPPARKQEPPTAPTAAADAAEGSAQAAPPTVSEPESPPAASEAPVVKAESAPLVEAPPGLVTLPRESLPLDDEKTIAGMTLPESAPPPAESRALTDPSALGDSISIAVELPPEPDKAAEPAPPEPTPAPPSAPSSGRLAPPPKPARRAPPPPPGARASTPPPPPAGAKQGRVSPPVSKSSRPLPPGVRPAETQYANSRSSDVTEVRPPLSLLDEDADAANVDDDELLDDNKR
ncbi:MAG TPA: hypothetical protein VGP93_10580, partial [Polyangiaceae bacterium]|nr:hypothetical protein [Polyangiaceae bacterium]